MYNYYLSIDIGASSGRHILGHLEGEKIVLEEVYRFSNQMTTKNGKLTWDVDALFQEILMGMKKCKDLEKIPISVGIDTWAVDFVLLDENDNRIGDVMAYRDSGTQTMDLKVYNTISEETLYEKTGIQKQIFNTIYQLMAYKTNNPVLFMKAKTMLMVPDYFHFLLSGKKVTEYTNASTTQLVSAITKNWNFDLISDLNYPSSLFQEIVLPGTCLGCLRQEAQNEVGYNCKIVIPATHDTASAVMSVPVSLHNTQKDILYISSGTWSLIGTELMQANCCEDSRKLNLTNEGGYNYRFRYLKNIMGLWMIQSVKKEIGDNKSYEEICEMASKTSIPSIIDVNANRFLAPTNMTEEVKKACEETRQQVPQNLAEIAAVIYNSLAQCYKEAISEIETITGKAFNTIHVVGGGSNATYLNKITAIVTGKPVLAGPAEATAIGNLSAQMIAAGELKDLSNARNCIYESFDIKKY